MPQVLYLLSHNAIKKERQNAIFKAAIELVKRFNMENRPVWLQWKLFEPLKRTIKDDANYRKIPWQKRIPADGIA